MVLEQRHGCLGGTHRLAFCALVLLAFICQSFGQPILRTPLTTNPVANAVGFLENNGSGGLSFSSVVSGTNFDGINVTNKIHILPGTFGANNWYVYTVGSGLWFSNAGGNVIIVDNDGIRQIVASSNNGANYLYTGTQVSNVLNSILTGENVFTGNSNTFNALVASNAFRLDTGTSFQDNEYITEARMDSVIAGLAGQHFYLWTNAHPFVSGTRMAADVAATSQFLTNVTAVGSNFVATWLTTNFVTGGIIKAGAYHLHIHGFKTQDAPLISLGWDLVRTNGSGIVTIATGDTTAGAFSTDSSYTLHVNLVSDILVSTNDVIGARFYVTKTGGGANWITHVGGTTDSQLETPSLGTTANVVSQNGGTVTNLTVQGFVINTTTTNSSEIPPTNQFTFGGYNLAGFGIPYWKTDASNLFFTQPSSFGHDQHWLYPGQGAPVLINGSTIGPGGTYFIFNAAPGQPSEYFGNAAGYNATAVSNNAAHVYPGFVCATGTRKGYNGYILGIRFGTTNQVEIGGGGIGLFAGVGLGTDGDTPVQTTNANAQRMGVQVFGQMGSSNFFWVSRDTAGNEFRRDTTMSLYASNTYELHMYCPPQSGTIGWKLANLDRGEYTNSFETTSLCTNILNPAIVIVNKTNRIHGFFFNWIHAITSLGF